MEKEKFFKEDCPIEVNKDSKEKEVTEKEKQSQQRSELFY